MQSKSERHQRPVSARWAKLTEAQRREALRPAREAGVGKRTGRPRSLDRCACGKNSYARARARGFACCRREKRKLEAVGIRVPWSLS